MSVFQQRFQFGRVASHYELVASAQDEGAPVTRLDRLGGRFIDDSTRLRTANAPPAPRTIIPYFGYGTPSFKALTPAQRAWYLYWRRRWRAGEVPETDAGAVLLLAAELLHLAYEPDPEAALALLRRLGADYPSYSHFMSRRWIGDLAWELGHHDEARALWSEWHVPRGLASREAARDDLRKRTWEIARTLSPWPETAYARKHQARLGEMFEALFAEMNEYFEQALGMLVLEAFNGRIVELPYTMYQGLVLERPLLAEPPPTEFVAEYWAAGPHVTQILRQVENLDRAFGRARPLIVRTSPLARNVRPVLTRYLKTRAPAVVERFLPEELRPKPAVSEISLDKGRLRDLTRQTEHVQALLAEALADGAAAEATRPASAAPALPTRIASVDELFAARATVDEAGLVELLRSSNAAELALLRLALAPEASPAEASRLARRHRRMVNDAIEQLNDRAVELFGEPILTLDDATFAPTIDPAELGRALDAVIAGAR